MGESGCHQGVLNGQTKFTAFEISQSRVIVRRSLQGLRLFPVGRQLSQAGILRLEAKNLRQGCISWKKVRIHFNRLLIALYGPLEAALLLQNPSPLKMGASIV